jgi:hypothetical protein
LFAWFIDHSKADELKSRGPRDRRNALPANHRGKKDSGKNGSKRCQSGRI